MNIQGFQKMTLLDFPGKVACTVFTGGCNMRCPFCHNAGLVLSPTEYGNMTDEVLEFLPKRVGLVDGVCITGGEPLLQPDIVDFVKKVKGMGYLVKLDTNGCYPEKLKELVQNGLVDYVAMDIKNCKEKYPLTVGIENFDLSKIEESVEFLINCGIDFEFRTTITAELHTVEDIKKISEWIKGAPKYFLQNFVDSGNLIGENFSAHKRDVLQQMREVALCTISCVEIRGI